MKTTKVKYANLTLDQHSKKEPKMRERSHALVARAKLNRAERLNPRKKAERNRRYNQTADYSYPNLTKKLVQTERIKFYDAAKLFRKLNSIVAYFILERLDDSIDGIVQFWIRNYEHHRVKRKGRCNIDSQESRVRN